MSVRGSGITSRQIESATHGAVYVWVNSDFSYPRLLAHHLGRRDLRFTSPGLVESGALRGLLVPQIVIDHAARRLLTSQAWQEVIYARQRIDMWLNL